MKTNPLKGEPIEILFCDSPEMMHLPELREAPSLAVTECTRLATDPETSGWGRTHLTSNSDAMVISSYSMDSGDWADEGGEFSEVELDEESSEDAWGNDHIADPGVRNAAQIVSLLQEAARLGYPGLMLDLTPSLLDPDSPDFWKINLMHLNLYIPFTYNSWDTLFWGFDETNRLRRQVAIYLAPHIVALLLHTGHSDTILLPTLLLLCVLNVEYRSCLLCPDRLGDHDIAPGFFGRAGLAELMFVQDTRSVIKYVNEQMPLFPSGPESFHCTMNGVCRKSAMEWRREVEKEGFFDPFLPGYNHVVETMCHPCMSQTLNQRAEGVNSLRERLPYCIRAQGWRALFKQSGLRRADMPGLRFLGSSQSSMER